MPRLNEIIDILKQSKHSTPRPMFCPNCQSPKIKIRESYGILPQMYYCEECGYEGHLILELEPEDEET
ncbi:hypothetical protein MUP51_00920 [Candidatus Bathyarchaeota archaeon]|nr:hypothetical protein [Candidatus Bathyarchaeota archaeon]